MRLLQYDDDGDLSLTEFFESDIPKYAILSHTWGAEEARRDGLQYFWVDTCCIDKPNSSELAEAINSMFRWYQDATRCYAYLSDVSKPAFDTNDKSNKLHWEVAFRKSRWFTRGWTLQELIAPTSVEFFSKEGELLGNKSMLETAISSITGISLDVLRGHPLAECTIEERMTWAKARITKREEDHVYSLFGIFDVTMPLVYGEGKVKAFRRLYEEISRYGK
ncbi:heterokaryon incompatibility protein-domain-containing protein [Hyaloscypha finlandica]|nr:heterokaryon incompatibility protein-domain-containing protein [Hyaloscypha finlandica]